MATFVANAQYELHVPYTYAEEVTSKWGGGGGGEPLVLYESVGGGGRNIKT